MMWQYLFSWKNWENPWWFLLVIIFVLGLFLRQRSHYLKKAHIHFAPLYMQPMESTRKVLTQAIPAIFSFLTMLAITGALANFNIGYIRIQEEEASNRIIGSVDTSGSMVVQRPYTSSPVGAAVVTCNTNSWWYPRAHGACRTLYKLLDEIEMHSKKRKDDSIKDLVGLFVFGTASYVLSQPSSDYAAIRTKVDTFNWKDERISGSTNFHLALWDMFLMALERNTFKDSGFTYLSGAEIKILGNSLRAPGNFFPPPFLEDKLKRIRSELRDTVLFLVTDTEIGALDTPEYSARKLLQLAAFLEMPVYVISVEMFDMNLKNLLKRTGFGPPDGPGRGDLFVVKKERDLYNIEKLVDDILKTRFSLRVSTFREERKFYGWWFVLAALTFASIRVFLKMKFDRSLTDVE